MLADKAGVHRTTIGLLERNERSPTMEMVLRLADALGVELSVLLARAEAIVGGKSSVTAKQVATRVVDEAHFYEEPALMRLTGLTHACLKKAIENCYQTLDTIDFELATHGSLPMAKLVELANLSSMVGNLLGGGIAQHSGGLYTRNRPHSYPDLVPVPPHKKNVEIKLALDTNKPKGHLAKPGTYLTFRYILAAKDGTFLRGKTNRGDTVFIWEAKLGKLSLADFANSNTEGDSGKTAVIKSSAFDAMSVVYFVDELLPYARERWGYPSRPKPN